MYKNIMLGMLLIKNQDSLVHTLNTNIIQQVKLVHKA